MNDKTTPQTCIKQYIIIMTDTTVTILSDIWGTYTGIEELERLNFNHFPTIPWTLKRAQVKVKVLLGCIPN